MSTSATSYADRLRAAARLAETIGERAELAVSVPSAPSLPVDAQLVYHDADTSAARDAARLARLRGVAALLDVAPGSTLADIGTGPITVSLHTTVDGVPVEVWARIEAPEVAAEARAWIAGDPPPAPAGDTAPDPAATIADTLVTVAESGGDVAEVLSAALAETAGRLGSVDALIRRPGAWETAHILALAGGAR